MPPKPWYQSLTLYWNLLSLLVIIAGVVADPAMTADPRIVTIAAAVVTIGNAMLRVLKTNAAIAGSPAASEPPPT